MSRRPKPIEPPKRWSDRMTVSIQLTEGTQETQKDVLESILKYLDEIKIPVLHFSDSPLYIYCAVKGEQKVKSNSLQILHWWQYTLNKKLMAQKLMARIKINKTLYISDGRAINSPDNACTKTNVDNGLHQELGDGLYVISNDDEVLYVGQSKDVSGRLAQHLGICSRNSRKEDSPLTSLMKKRKPTSRYWTLQFFSLSNCEDLIVQTLLLSEEKTPENIEEVKNHYRSDHDWASKMAELFLIAWYRPAINDDNNPFMRPIKD